MFTILPFPRGKERARHSVCVDKIRQKGYTTRRENWGNVPFVHYLTEATRRCKSQRNIFIWLHCSVTKATQAGGEGRWFFFAMRGMWRSHCRQTCWSGDYYSHPILPQRDIYFWVVHYCFDSCSPGHPRTYKVPARPCVCTLVHWSLTSSSFTGSGSQCVAMSDQPTYQQCHILSFLLIFTAFQSYPSNFLSATTNHIPVCNHQSTFLDKGAVQTWWQISDINGQWY